MEKSSTTTGSDDALYMTDDLEGRLGPEELVEPAKKPPPIVLGVYLGEEDGPSAPEEPLPGSERSRASVFVEVTVQDSPDAPFRVESTIVEGVLDAFSFGKGWLVTLSDVDEKFAFKIGRELARREGVSKIRVGALVGGDALQLSGDLDFTIGYGFSGCTFTVSADEGSYVEA